jgi:N-acetyl-anhydromuramyl-L-alanine amidase AmpD
MPNKSTNKLIIWLMYAVPMAVLVFIVRVKAQEQTPTIIKKHLPAKCYKERGADKQITHLMLHFCSYVLEDPKNPYKVEDIYNTFVKYGVSAHYLIARDGTIYELVPESKIAYHAGKGTLPQTPAHTNNLNDYSVGIEIMGIGTKSEMSFFGLSAKDYDQLKKEDIGFTEAQYTALNQLIPDILSRNKGILKDRQHIVGHDEYAPTRRKDPGALFEWNKIGL